jgi:tetratricopeptide (TPR) repeat protein
MADPEYEAISKAKRQRDSGNPKGALDTLENYLLGDPYNAKVRMLVSQIAFSIGMEQYGLIQLDAIIDFNPENIEARKALVTILKKNKRNNKETKELYDYLVEHCPGDADLLNSYAIFSKMQLTDFHKSAELYEKAISIDPNVSEYHLNYSILLVNDLKDYVKGKAELERAIELDPYNTRAKDALARLIKKKFRDEAPKRGLFSRKK